MVIQNSVNEKMNIFLPMDMWIMNLVIFASSGADVDVIGRSRLIFFVTGAAFCCGRKNSIRV